MEKSLDHRTMIAEIEFNIDKENVDVKIKSMKLKNKFYTSIFIYREFKGCNEI